MGYNEAAKNLMDGLAPFATLVCFLILFVTLLPAMVIMVYRTVSGGGKPVDPMIRNYLIGLFGFSIAGTTGGVGSGLLPASLTASLSKILAGAAREQKLPLGFENSLSPSNESSLSSHILVDASAQFKVDGILKGHAAPTSSSSSPPLAKPATVYVQISGEADRRRYAALIKALSGKAYNIPVAEVMGYTIKADEIRYCNPVDQPGAQALAATLATSVGSFAVKQISSCDQQKNVGVFEVWMQASAS